MNTTWLNSGGNQPFFGDYKVTNLGGSYDAGSVKLFAQYGEQTQGSFTSALYTANAAPNANTGVYTVNGTLAQASTLKHYLLGATVPMGNWLYKASYGSGTRSAGGLTAANAAITNDRTYTQFALGAVYNFSKRTAVYGTYSAMTGTGLGATVSQGVLTSTAVTATSGDVKASGFDVGVRHSF